MARVSAVMLSRYLALTEQPCFLTAMLSAVRTVLHLIVIPHFLSNSSPFTPRGGFYVRHSSDMPKQFLWVTHGRLC